ncbi:MAG: pseudouridine synthase [Veillonella sp.]|nr:pseudouridine synthase [Veillonella sp.]
MDGILPFLKPPGITSHDAVAICRRILKEKRIGHSGTLDPMAYGVLPVFLGKATRLIEYTDEFDKTYVAECKLGTFTDTEDSSGQPVLPDNDMLLRDGIVLNRAIQSTEISTTMVKPGFEELVSILRKFAGVQDQRPSKYSAIKVNGIRAYEYARKGIPVDLPLCSGGTYIRSLLRDICIALGIPGTMTSLARTQVGPFDIGSAKMAEELMLHGERLLLPTDTAVSHLSKVTVNSVQLRMMIEGKQLPIGKEFAFTEIGQLYRAYGPNGFIGIMKRNNHTLKVEKNIFIEG